MTESRQHASCFHLSQSKHRCKTVFVCRCNIVGLVAEEHQASTSLPGWRNNFFGFQHSLSLPESIALRMRCSRP